MFFWSRRVSPISIAEKTEGQSLMTDEIVILCWNSRLFVIDMLPDMTEWVVR